MLSAFVSTFSVQTKIGLISVHRRPMIGLVDADWLAYVLLIIGLSDVCDIELQGRTRMVVM